MDALTVRKLVTAALPALGRASAALVEEHLIFYDGSLVGFSFEFAELTAVWLFALRQVKFVSESGQLLQVIELDTPPTATKRVA